MNPNVSPGMTALPAPAAAAPAPAQMPIVDDTPSVLAAL